MALRIESSRASSLSVNLAIVYLVIGLLFHLLYYGFPWPFSLSTWLHVLIWPYFIVLRVLRWVFVPFAMIAIVALVATYFYSQRRARP